MPSKTLSRTLLAFVLFLPQFSTAANLVLNGNFTGGASTGWAYAETDSGNIAASNFVASGGNYDPGAWYFEANDRSNKAAYTANGNLTNGGSYWDGTTPTSAKALFSSRQPWSSAAPTANTIRVYLVKPGGFKELLFTRSSTATDSAYTNAEVAIGVGNFSTAGTYQLILYNYVETAASPRPNVQNYWDDVSLFLTTPAVLGTPSFSNQSDLDIGKNNPNDNATAQCLASCTGGDCEGFGVALQSDDSGSWQDAVSSARITVNQSALFYCGTGVSCSAAWQVQGRYNSTYNLRCKANASSPSSTTYSTQSQLRIFSGVLGSPSQNPSATQDVSFYDQILLSATVSCTAPSNANASCGTDTMTVRTDDSGAAPSAAITPITQIKLDLGTNAQQQQCWTGSSGTCDLSFSPITANVTYADAAPGGVTRYWDLLVTSDDSQVSSVDGADAAIRGHANTPSISLVSGEFSASTGSALGNVNCSLSCSASPAYRCINSQLWPRYNATAAIDALIPLSGNPARLSSGSQPQYVSLIEPGAIAYASWSLVAGTTAGKWRYNVLYNSTVAGISPQDSPESAFEILPGNLPPFSSNEQANDSAPLPGGQVEHAAYWADDTALSTFIFSWNGTTCASDGAFVNDSVQAFSANPQWANVSKAIPNNCEGKPIHWKQFVNDSDNDGAATAEFVYAVQNVAPSVAVTATNTSIIQVNRFFCVNASATDTGTGVAEAWVTITFPNETIANVSLSDTGCNSGGAGDGAYGALVNTSTSEGMLWINATWANDSAGNLGFEFPAPLSVNVTVPAYESTVLRPNGTGTYTEWATQFPASGNHFDKTSETSADGDASYVESSNANDRDLFELSDLQSSDVEIANVTIYFVSEKTVSQAASIASLIRTNAADYEGTAQIQTRGVYNVFSEFYDDNPQTAQEWTAVEANALEAGVVLKSSRNVRTTQVFVEIFHTKSAFKSPTANATSANVSRTPANSSFCINATAGWGTNPVSMVWATVSFPNSTVSNASFSDTGCAAGGAGDGWYGAQFNSTSSGVFFVNETWANDSSGTLAKQSPSPEINVTIGNGVGGSDAYVGFYGNLSFQLRNNTGGGNLLYSSQGRAGSIFLSAAGASPNWLSLQAASRSPDLPAMSAALGLSKPADLLENNYADGYADTCGLSSVSYMLSSDGNWKIGVLYSDEDSSGAYSAGDNVLFCTEIITASANYLGLQSNYEIAFPKAFANNADFWYELQ